MEFGNVYSLFRSQCERFGDRPVFYTRENGTWTPQTWADFEQKVLDIGCALLAKGLTRGGKVAILAGNIPEWTMIDVAAISAGGVGEIGRAHV